MDSKKLAEDFHDAYEELAPSFGYETRDDTKVFDPSSPNGQLMIAVCHKVMSPVFAEVSILKEPMAAMFTWFYNQGYGQGHHDTVESMYTDILPVDMESYHDDIVYELIAEYARDSGSPKQCECFWPTGCANSERCSEAGMCIARWQNANKDKLFAQARRDADDSRRTIKFVDHPEIYRHTPDCPLYREGTSECTCADSRPTENPGDQ